MLDSGDDLVVFLRFVSFSDELPFVIGSLSEPSSFPASGDFLDLLAGGEGEASPFVTGSETSLEDFFVFLTDFESLVDS